MRKLICFFGISLFIASFAIADTVVRRPVTLTLPTVTREGLYTGETDNDGVPNGFGLFEAVNDDGINWHYIGEWKDGMMNGHGQSNWETGKTLTGLYVNNDFISGNQMPDAENYTWLDKNDTITVKDDMAVRFKIYENNRIRFDGYLMTSNNKFYKGTRYNADGSIDSTGYFNGYTPEE